MLTDHRGVAKHGLETCGGNHNFLVAAFYFVGKLDEHTELVLMLRVVPGYFVLWNVCAIINEFRKVVASG